MRYLTFILIFIGCFSTFEKDKQNKSSKNFYLYSYKSEHPDSLYLDLYLKLPKKDFVFIKKNNSFQSTINISINITDSLENKQIIHDSWKHKIIENNYQKTKEFGNNEILVKKIHIKKGLYKIFIHIQDYDSKNKWSMREVVSLEGYKRISDILVNYKYNGKFYPLFDRSANSIDSIYCFFQLNDRQDIDNLKVYIENFELNNLIINQIEGSDNFFNLVLPTSLINLNDPTLIFEIENSKKEMSIKFKHKDIDKLFKDPDLILEVMNYYGFINEKNLKNKSIEDKYKIIKDYWMDRDPTASTDKNELLNEFISRVRYSVDNFSVLGPGWRSDRGNILINYGYPINQEVSNSNDNRSTFLVWYFPNGRKVIFIDQDGFEDYKIYREVY